jgi:hypothetical protein
VIARGAVITRHAAFSILGVLAFTVILAVTA